MALVVVTEQSSRTLEDLAALLWDYTVEQGWQDEPGHTDEIRALPGPYAAPDGAIAVAYLDDDPVGCAVVRAGAVDADVAYAEMRRLYVRPHARRSGVARSIVLELDAVAADLGYASMRLVSLGEMVAAHELYRSLGFVDIPQYRPTDAPEPVFMEKRIRR